MDLTGRYAVVPASGGFESHTRHRNEGLDSVDKSTKLSLFCSDATDRLTLVPEITEEVMTGLPLALSA